MTIAANSYAEYIRALLGSPPIEGATRTIETPSVEPTLDGYVGVCTNSREQFHSFLLLIGRPDLIETDEFSNHVDRQARWDEWNEIVHAWTTQHTTADIVRHGQRAAHPGGAGARPATTSSSATTSSPARSSSTTPRARSRCRAVRGAWTTRTRRCRGRRRDSASTPA